MNCIGVSRRCSKWHGSLTNTGLEELLYWTATVLDFFVSISGQSQRIHPTASRLMFPPGESRILWGHQHLVFPSRVASNVIVSRRVWRNNGSTSWQKHR